MTAHGAIAPDDRPGRAHRYSAFISYSHADRAAVFRLHARLEAYRLPRHLAEQVGVTRIRPVFIDRAEMAASPDLAEVTRKALAETDFLIVACTPHTPKSEWVAREIDLFRELRGRDAILVALLAGDEKASFPRALLDDGHGRHCEPLAADFRHEGDGARLALLKLIATLLGVDLDELIRRDARRERNRKLAWAAATAAVALIIAGLGWSAYRAWGQAEQGQIVASQTMGHQLDDLRAQIKAGGTLDMAAAVTRNIALFYDQQPSGSELPEVELGKAKVLQAMTEDQLNRGDLKTADAKAREALRLTAGVIAREPQNTDAIFMHAQSAYWVGLVAWRQGDTPLAANAFARYADLANRLVKADPANSDWLLEQGYSNSNLGTLALREARDPKLAWRYFSAAQDAFRKVERRKPGEEASDLADGEAWLADTLYMAGDFRAARQHRAEQRRLLSGLIEKDPKNRQYRSLEIGAETGQAVIEGNLDNNAGAIRILQDALRKASALAAADPANRTETDRRRAVELFLARAELDNRRAD
ncbi:MAG: toll/interleukin-1 receptor domain-containing protein, partial [Porphyrobacter sp.]|nr:toll/interleukin-1 receptor domain-containing protein [Porphyrobacter sp.]